MVPKAAICLTVLFAAGCTWSVDADQARICRSALPALWPAGTAIRLTRTAAAAEPGGVRIEYRVLPREGGPDSAHVAICRFAASGLEAGKSDLVAVTNDGRAVAGATLYLLKHYYLETGEGQAGDPGPEDRNADLPVVPAALAYGAEQAIVGLPRTIIYGLMALAYALVFGLVGRINLAFGEIAAVGAATAGLAAMAVAGSASIAAGIVVAVGLALLAGGLHAAVAGRITFSIVPARRTQASLVATVGMSLALMEYLRIAGGTVTPWIPPVWNEVLPLARAGDFVVTATPVLLLTAGTGAAAILATLAVMRMSALGRDWRATSDDALAAALFGVDGERLLVRILGLAGALAGLAGALVAIQFGALGFAGGFQLGLKALAASVLGGIGSLPGALVGGLAIGVFETLWSALLPIEGRDLALYAVLVTTIVLKPDGLFGVAAPIGGRRP